jgi:predicted porin
MKRELHWFCAALTTATLTFSSPASSALNDIYPGDYLAAPAGTNALVVYAYDRSLEGPYRAGQNTGAQARDTNTLIILGATYFNIHETRVALSASAGRSRQSTADNSATTRDTVWGTTDPKVSITVWPLQMDKNSLAVNLAHVFPWGSYEAAAAQKIGQNRHRSALSLSWAHFFSPNFRTETTAELAFFQDNKDNPTGALRQKMAEALTAFGTYKLTKTVSPYLGYQWNTGGETAIGAGPYGGEDRFQRAFLGVRVGLPQDQILHIRGSRDTEKLTGLRLNREITVKWTKLY